MTAGAPSRPDPGRSSTGTALVVRGGDGAIFHILQTLRQPYPTLAIAAAGRGNALARDLRAFPSPVAVDLMEVLVHPASGEPFSRLCASSVAFGYPSAVTRRSLRFQTLGRLSYAAAACFTVPRPQLFQIQYDGAMFETKTLTGVLLNNTRHVGGFVALPHALCCDGHADSMELRSGYLAQLAHNLSSMTRAHLFLPAAVTPVTHAVIRPTEPGELMLDGELFPNVAAIELRVRPAAIQCYFFEP